MLRIAAAQQSSLMRLAFIGANNCQEWRLLASTIDTRVPFGLQWTA
jgi:hypothetical protein